MGKPRPHNTSPSEPAGRTCALRRAKMATKGVKSLLKAAKAAVGKRDYHEAARICQVRRTSESRSIQ